jgi:adenosylcobinamide kinase / adenosylcobinamide-phosphate guanylyltransferase
MHFIVGGAFQGKRKWAKQYYQLNDYHSYLWCNGYKTEFFLPNHKVTQSLVVFEGLETLIRQKLNTNLMSCRNEWAEAFQLWQLWENEKPERRVIWIGCDISQGIVPMNEEERNWRDVTGWCYQELVKMCNRVDRVWCGLAERMK